MFSNWKARWREGRGGWAALPAALAVCVSIAHAAALLFTVYESPRAAFNSSPLIDQDWGLHFQHLRALGAFWDRSGRLWGYNPDFMAGFASNTIQDFSVKLFELAALPFASSRARAFKISAFLATALIPWALWLAGRGFFPDPPEEGAGGEGQGDPDGHQLRMRMRAFLLCALGTVYWWNSFPREMFFYGMIGFPPACYLALATAAAAWRTMGAGTGRGGTSGAPGAVRSLGWPLAWCVGAALILPLHLQAALALAYFVGLMLALHLNGSSTHSRRGATMIAAWIVAGGALALLANAFWLWPLWTHRGDAAPGSLATVPVFAATRLADLWTDYGPGPPLWSFRETAAEKGWRWFLLIAGVAGMIRMRGEGDGRLAKFLGAATAGAFTVTYLGHWIPLIRAGQPLRFSVLLNALLCVGAAFQLQSVFTPNLLAAPEPRAHRARPAARVWAGLTLLGLLVFLFNARAFSAGGFVVRERFHPALDSIIAWVRDRAPADGRVLFEESGDETGFVYDGVYLSSFIPALTGRRLIGGPANLYNDGHHFAEFHSGMLCGRPVASMTDDEIRRVLDLYNIGSVVAFSPEAIARFQAMPGDFAPDGGQGRIRFFQTRRAPDWTPEGSARVGAEFNRIRVENPSGPLVLSYHWIEGLRSTPPTEIRPRLMPGDPNPFIELPNPPASCVLSVGEIPSRP